MFKGEFDRPHKLEDGSYYIEAHPECFESVLNFYRYGYLEQPENVATEFFLSQAMYWGVTTQMPSNEQDETQQMIEELGWPALNTQTASKVQTVAVNLKGNETQKVEMPYGMFMIEAIYSRQPYVLNVNGHVENGIVANGININSPLFEPIIPRWMHNTRFDVVFSREFTLHVTSQCDQTVLFRVCMEEPVNNVELLTFWDRWVNSRVQTKGMYPRDSSAVGRLEHLQHRKDFTKLFADVEEEFDF